MNDPCSNCGKLTPVDWDHMPGDFVWCSSECHAKYSRKHWEPRREPSSDKT